MRMAMSSVSSLNGYSRNAVLEAVRKSDTPFGTRTARVCQPHALVEAIAKADLLLQDPAAGLHPDAAIGVEVVRVEAADEIRMAVDGEVVVDVGDRAAAGGHAEDAALDEDYLATGRAGRRPGEHRVLEDHAAGEVPELAEVRVVDLDEEPEILAHVAVEGEARAAHEHVRGPAGAVRRAVLVEQGVRLDVDPEVQVHALDGHGQLDCVSGERRDREKSDEKGLPVSPHSRSFPAWCC